MANTKISALASAAALTGAEKFPLVQSGATVQVAWSAIITAIDAASFTFSAVQVFAGGVNVPLAGGGTTPLVDASGNFFCPGGTWTDGGGSAPDATHVLLGNSGTTAVWVTLASLHIATTNADNAFSVTQTFSKGQYSPIKTNTDPGGVTPTITFDLSASNLQFLQLTGVGRILALSNEPATGDFTIILQQDGSGSRTVTWFSGIKWLGAAAPTLTTTANRYDVLQFTKVSAGVYLGWAKALNCG